MVSETAGSQKVRARGPLAGGALVAMMVAAAAAAGSVGAEETRNERRIRIEQMQPEQKERLRRRAEQFDRLDPSQQRRIRDLDAALSSNDRESELRRVMRQYYEWLKTLSPGERAELRNLAGQERIARIREIREEQNREQLRRWGGIPREDIQRVTEWMHDYAKKRERELVEKMPERFRGQFDAAGKDDQQRMLVFNVFAPMMRPPFQLPELTEQDYADLAGRLSKKTASTLRAQSDPIKRSQMVRPWINHVIRFRMFRRGGEPRRDRPSNENLQKIFEGLDKRQQDMLSEMSTEQMQHELRRLYYEERFGGRRGGSRGRRPSPASNRSEEGNGQGTQPPGQREPRRLDDRDRPHGREFEKGPSGHRPDGRERRPDGPPIIPPTPGDEFP